MGVDQMYSVEEFFHRCGDPCAVLDRQDRISSANPALAGLLRWSPEELQARPWTHFVHPDDIQQMRQAISACIHDGTAVVENRWRRSDGGYRTLAWSATASSNGHHIYAIGRDRTEEVRVREALEQANRKLVQLASEDELTGLANRRMFQRRLTEELLRAHRGSVPLSVIFADIDYFKRFNDAHGHAAGDGALVEFSSVLRGTVRRIDLVARVGGEEFAVVAPETGLDDAAKLASRLQSAIHEHIWSLQPITASFGVAAVDEFRYRDGALDTAATISRILEHADGALYRAKQKGRDRVELHHGNAGRAAGLIVHTGTR